jgi:metal-responsive CopG/Arc/MetJ family transcriptional regulator
MVTQVERLTISLPRDLIQLTDAIAKEKKISRSKVVSDCLREMAEKRLQAEMVEGYKATAKANLKFAEDSIHLANEILARNNIVRKTR